MYIFEFAYQPLLAAAGRCWLLAFAGDFSDWLLAEQPLPQTPFFPSRHKCGRWRHAVSCASHGNDGKNTAILLSSVSMFTL